MFSLTNHLDIRTARNEVQILLTTWVCNYAWLTDEFCTLSVSLQTHHYPCNIYEQQSEPNLFLKTEFGHLIHTQIIKSKYHNI